MAGHMKIVCTHGYFEFFETYVGEVSDFLNLYTDISLVPKGDCFVFEKFQNAPDYSLPGIPFLDVIATQIFEGSPGEVMRKNGLIYDFDRDLVVPIDSVVDVDSLEAAGNYFFSNGLLMPGALTVEGMRVTDYSAWFYAKGTRIKYTGVIYV